jgi:hypothetical protein
MLKQEKLLQTNFQILLIFGIYIYFFFPAVHV